MLCHTYAVECMAAPTARTSIQVPNTSFTQAPSVRVRSHHQNERSYHARSPGECFSQAQGPHREGGKESTEPALCSGCMLRVWQRENDAFWCLVIKSKETCWHIWVHYLLLRSLFRKLIHKEKYICNSKLCPGNQYCECCVSERCTGRMVDRLQIKLPVN